MRRVFGVAALSLFLAVSVSGEPGSQGRRKEPPLAKIARVLQNVLRTFGDGIITPRP